MRSAALVVAALVLIAGRFAFADTVGERNVLVPAPERPALLHASLWYPATRNGDSVLLGGNAVFSGTPALQNAPIAAGRFPLVLISHGGLRAAPNTGNWLASALAGAGFITVVVNPPPIPSGPATQAVLSELWLRSADLSATLEFIEKQPKLADHVDTAKVGAIGFFLGGFAVMELAGARVDSGVYARSCDGVTASLDCSWFAAGGVDLHRVDAARLGQTHLDPRFRAAVVVDPELASTFLKRSLKSISIPIHIINLGRPGAIPSALDASNLVTEIPGASYAAMSGAGRSARFRNASQKGSRS